jgi:hypothetical protein
LHALKQENKWIFEFVLGLFGFSVFLYFFGEKVAVGAIDLAKAPEK